MVASSPRYTQHSDGVPIFFYCFPKNGEGVFIGGNVFAAESFQETSC